MLEQNSQGCFPPLSKIQILVHEKRIPTKIEIFLSIHKPRIVDKDSNKDDVLQDISQIDDEERLGYVTFDCNAKTKYSTRELKSIKLDDRSNIRTLKFVVHGYHESVPDNTKFQIGIVSLCLFSKNTGGICSHSNTLMIDTNATESTPIATSPIHKKNSELINLNKSTQCSNSLLASITVETDQSSNSSIESKIRSLEDLKLQKAKIEDFESAAKIKAILISLTSLITSRNAFDVAMKEAANKEEYVEAAKWKAKRDSARKDLETALSRAEEVVASKLVQVDFNPSIINSNLNDLSLSTIRRSEDDDVSSIAMTTTATRSFPFDDRPIVQRTDPNYNSMDMTVHHEVSSTSTEKDNEENDIDHFENGQHPLEGVPDFLSLPKPEENLIHQGVSKTMNALASHASSDSISKIEGILGPYRTRCFLSKNWALREAAVLKLRMIFPELVSTEQSSNTELNWWDYFSRGMCIIIERCLEDKVVQVFLTGCIVLDDFMQETTKRSLSQKEALSLFGNLINILDSKLGDSNTKVAEAAETLLMSFALTESVGPSYVGSQVLKNSGLDSKTVKSICRRCLFLKQLIHEFELLGTPSEKIVEFILKFGVNHKDAEAREAAKELFVQLYVLDQNILSSVMDHLSERQVKEFNIAIRKEQNNRINENLSSEKNDCRILNMITGELTSQTPGRRGRGRGRGRGKITVSQMTNDGIFAN